ncbi:hypothetical protein SUDANB105_07613 [Streptomyces sp. enrichment culture]
MATCLLGRHQGPSVAAWALLIGTLTAHLPHHAARRPDQHSNQPHPKERTSVTEHHVGTILATAGAVLSLTGTGMYVPPGPGLPVLITGVAALTTGLVMTAATRR